MDPSKRMWRKCRIEPRPPKTERKTKQNKRKTQMEAPPPVISRRPAANERQRRMLLIKLTSITMRCRLSGRPSRRCPPFRCRPPPHTPWPPCPPPSPALKNRSSLWLLFFLGSGFVLFRFFFQLSPTGNSAVWSARNEGAVRTEKLGKKKILGNHFFLQIRDTSVAEEHHHHVEN